ncbi:MAG: dTDP-glucose 4,6-dehydratase [Candidatus Diapherotrites archaeon]
MKILVTGGCGFIGSHFIKETLRQNEDWEIINLDKLTYAGRKENLVEIENNPHYTFMKGDICDPMVVEKAMRGVDAVINFAAESHVDRSIQDARAFIRTDVEGAFTLLDAARKNEVKKFVQISTDEVYGQIMSGSFTEESLLNPRNPYSASKAGADRLAYSFHSTYGMDVCITRSSNNYGTHQYPEKLIPLFITHLIQEKKVPVYGEGKNIRDWLHVKDNCAALLGVLEKGKSGEVYNIGGGNERTNMEITRSILAEMGKGDEMITYVEDRKGHDWRYSLDSRKIEHELGWRPRVPFEQGLRETIRWYAQNEKWWKPLVERPIK